MSKFINRNRFSGYKGFARINREAEKTIKNVILHTDNAAANGSAQPDKQQNTTMADNTAAANPFIGDNFFKLNPDKVLGVQSTRKGRFGNDMIVVEGSIDNIKNIDVPQMAVVDLFPQQVFAVENKQEMIEKVFAQEYEEVKKEKIRSIRKQTEKPKVISSDLSQQEVYSYEEISEMYNKQISRDEMEAYYFTHPELNYKLLFEKYKNNKEDLIKKGLICYDPEERKFVYVYTYQSQNIGRKISALKRDREHMLTVIDEDQYNRQMQMLESVKPKSKALIGEDKIILLPHSNFAKEMMVTELRPGAPELHSAMSLFNAFKVYLRELPFEDFKKSNSKEIIDYYLDNKSLTVDSKASKEERTRQEKNNINTKQRSKTEGDLLFSKFLAEELLPEDQATIAYLWNEKFNSIAEPNLTKIPVCFRISKTFKAGAPLMLNPTQRQAAAFIMEKYSGLFAYGVGVGKTLASIVCLSHAYDNELAKKFIFVVPTNTYDKWIGEIQGYTDPETGKFMQGALPHLPPVVGLYNLNPILVHDTLKIYTKDEEAIFESIQNAINYVKKLGNKDDINEKENERLYKIYPIFVAGIREEYKNAYLEKTKSAKPKTFTEYLVTYLKEEYNYKVYELGKLKSFPDGTIFVTTEVGLQRLGVSENHKERMKDELFTILSQGDKTADKSGERDIAGLQIKIEERVSSSLKNAKLNIEDFGIDWACFDESHYYKKLFTFVKGTTKKVDETNQYKRISAGEREKSKYEIKSGAYPSNRALSAYVLSHYIQTTNNNRNVIQLTATPFTNSPLEVYSMLTLTNYKSLKDIGFGNMTDFFDTFMKINWDIKYTPQKTVVKDVVLQGYNNLSQLRQVIYSLMDKKDEGANLKRPKKIVMPSEQYGIETTLPMTMEQNELMAEVKKYINGDIDYSMICTAAAQEEVDSMDFDALDDEALVMEYERVTEKDYDGPREGLSEGQRDKLIAAIKSSKSKGLELTTEELNDEESLGVKILKGLSMMRQITLSPFLYHKACRRAMGGAPVMPNYKEYINSSPKLKYVMGCINSIRQYHVDHNQKISGQVIYMNAGVEYFVLIKEFLVKELHFKESQIGIVSGGMSKGAKETVKQGFLRGDILVLIGSQTISVGVDLQNNSTVLYNCYYDWNPTDAAQIEGRIWRQGNRFSNVRIVYPQCYNSADPVIFEYLNVKTIRINEIWNRSSTEQELDLRDFDPKKLQKRLITDPDERADFQILELRDKLDDEIRYFENKRGLLEKSIFSYREFVRLKPAVIKWMNEVVNTRNRIKKEDAVAQQREKISEIVEKFENDDVKMAKELKAYKESRYDHEKDEEGKYAPVDYSTFDDAKLYNEADKVGKYIDEIKWNAQERWGELYDKRWDIKEDLTSFRGSYRDKNAAEERILIPMGLSFATASNPIGELNSKIAGLRDQFDALESGKAELVRQFTIELKSMQKTFKTVEQRIEEFSIMNGQAYSFSDGIILDQQLDYGAPVIQDAEVVEEKPALTEPEIIEAVTQMAGGSNNFETFMTRIKTLSGNWNVDINSDEFKKAFGLDASTPKENVKKLKDFYNSVGIDRKKENKQKQDDAKAEIAVNDILKLAESANEANEKFVVKYQILDILNSLKDYQPGSVVAKLNKKQWAEYEDNENNNYHADNLKMVSLLTKDENIWNAGKKYYDYLLNPENHIPELEELERRLVTIIRIEIKEDEKPKPVEVPVIDKKAAIEKQIKALTSVLKYTSSDEGKAKINKQIKALTTTLKFI